MPEEEKKHSRMKVEVVEEPENKDKEQTNVDKESENKSSEKLSEDKSVNTDTDEHNSDEYNRNMETQTKPDSADKLPIWILFIAFFIGLILGAGLIGGFFYYKGNINKDTFKLSNSPAPAVEEVTQETATPTPTASEKIDYSKLTVNILNGSGIKGEAAKVEELIKDLGFKSIDTGNASSYDFQETEISLKPEVNSQVYDELVKSLSTYSVKKGTELKSSSKFDVVITVGSKKK